MIQNRNITKAARSRNLTVYMDIDQTTPVHDFFVVEPENAIKIESIDAFYVVATNGGTRPDNITVGTLASGTLYANFTPAGSQAAGTRTKIAPSSSALVPAGTPLRVRRAAAAGGTNTGEVTLTVRYSIVDTGAPQA